jgi:hypothetical protein
MLAEDACSKCGKEAGRGGLSKCPMCYKLVCEECHFQMSGRIFCSAPCSQFFFFEGDEDEG